MKIKKWISLSEAVELIIDKRFAETVGDHTLATYRYAYTLILEALESGSLPARPKSPDLYKFEFVSDTDHRSIPLIDDGTIPATFWHHLKSTYDEAPGLASIYRDYAEITPFVRFRQSRGIKDSGFLTGEAGTVLVERTKLPVRIRQRGERGSNRIEGQDATYTEADQPFVDQALNRISKGEDRTLVIQALAPGMVPASVQISSKERRLGRAIDRRLNLDK